MTFGQALEELKKGNKVARSGWNGKGMFIYLVKGTRVGYDRLRNEAATHLQADSDLNKGRTVIINSHIDMKAADGSIVVGWQASQTDMLSDDWQVVI